MKKLLSLFAALCLLLPSCLCLAFAADAELRIVIPQAGTSEDRYAADVLQTYLSQITGKTPQIVSDDAASSGTEIAVGATDRDTFDATGLKHGGYHIGRSDETICIQGAGEKGTLNGVYAFLREYCGCRWYAPEEIVVPKADTLSLPDAIDVTYVPRFEYTSTDWRTMCDDTIAAANGLTGNGCYIYGFCHTLATRFCSRDKYFDEHPEYFALHDGKRTPNQLCLTNPDTLRIVTEEVLGVLQTHHDPDADLQIISITQDDNGDYCECPDCKALDDANGSHAGTNVTFANAVADAVKAAGYDNTAIDTFAYEYTRKPPTNVVPRDNVIIRLCDIECCFCHTLDDEKCKENRDFMQDLSGWGKICRRVYIWDYTTNYWETTCLYPDFGVLQRNMQIFFENNAKGIFEEGEPSLDDNAEFGELRGYLLARLMQDPYMDYDAEMQGFLNAYYGKGGEPLYRFLQRVTEKAGASYRRRLGTFPRSEETLTCFTAEDVAFSDDCWREAKELTRDTPYFARVERAELCWRWWKCSNNKGTFSPLRSTLYTRMRDREALYNDLKRMGVSYVNHTRREREITDSMTLVLLRRPGKWCRLYEEAYWDAIEPAVVWLYGILGKLHGLFGR